MVVQSSIKSQPIMGIQAEIGVRPRCRWIHPHVTLSQQNLDLSKPNHGISWVYLHINNYVQQLSLSTKMLAEKDPRPGWFSSLSGVMIFMGLGQTVYPQQMVESKNMLSFRRAMAGPYTASWSRNGNGFQWACLPLDSWNDTENTPWKYIMFLDFHVICFVNLPPAGVLDLKMEITDVAAPWSSSVSDGDPQQSVKQCRKASRVGNSTL